ncbi:hypothetical protein [Vibrio alginolyticus]|uniref:hypothetical protein n=1 Tax=Vibrio alginolyticus TaxID=663 RepID=UPI003B685816
MSFDLFLVWFAVSEADLLVESQLCGIVSPKHNKAFKRDSQRLAVLVQSLAFVFMAQWFKLGGIALFTP